MDILKDLNLTDKDFKLLVNGLEALPDAGSSGELISGIMMRMMAKDGPPGFLEKLKHDETREALKRKHEKENLIEDVKILQGKLLMFKRYLVENNLMKQVNETLNPEKR